jgi:hypothetical protein
VRKDSPVGSITAVEISIVGSIYQQNPQCKGRLDEDTKLVGALNAPWHERAVHLQTYPRTRWATNARNHERVVFGYRSFNGEHMTHPSLLNPFSPNQQSGIVFGRQGGRATPVCSQCQSDDIISHATAQWSNESQQWELANTFAQPAHCNRCNNPCDIVWLPLNWTREADS